MPGYVVVQVTIRDAEAYARYRELAQASVTAHGGRYIVRGGATETLEGTWSPSRLVILEFPSVAAARRWWDSPEYAAARALRQASADSELLVAEGLTPAP